MTAKFLNAVFSLNEPELLKSQTVIFLLQKIYK